MKDSLDLLACMYAQSLSHVGLSVTPWTGAHQVPLSMEFSRRGYWSGLPFPTPRDLPTPGIKLASLASCALADSLPLNHLGKFLVSLNKLESRQLDFLLTLNQSLLFI